MFSELFLNNNVISEDIKKLKLFLNSNEYDSDRLIYDIDDYIENENENNSNIVIIFKNKKQMLLKLKEDYY